MKRLLINQLKAWKTSECRKPLLLMGARQVGKTTLVRQFGNQEYQNIVEINFDDRPELKRLFEENLVPARIIRDISVELDVQIHPADTLLFFDETECVRGFETITLSRK